jgi:Holliday junction resolvase
MNSGLITMKKVAGREAEEQAEKWIVEWSAAIATALAPYEPAHTFDFWFNALRGIEELINLPGELDDDDLLERILALPLQDIVTVGRSLGAIQSELEYQFATGVATRLRGTIRQICAIAMAFSIHKVPVNPPLRTVGAAIDYFQSRRRHFLALLHTIPKACRGDRRLTEIEGIGHFAYLIESAGIGLTNMHQNLMLAKVYPDFEMEITKHGVMANHGFDALNQAFLEPERSDITEMPMDKLHGVKLQSVPDDLIFSTAELLNNLKVISAAYDEFHLAQTAFGPVVALIQSLAPLIVDNYLVRLPRVRLEQLATGAGLAPFLKDQLVVDDDNFVRNTCSYSPFTVIGEEVVSSVTLLTRFAYRCKSLILNRVRRYQIRSGFIFEDSVKEALRRQGFNVTDIKRVGHAEFDVVATLDGVIYNVQCKNNLVDLNRVETDLKRFVRYNRSLDAAYVKALKKEEAREAVLTTKLGIPNIKHLLVSRFPVATENKRVIPFGKIHRFRAIAEGL